MIGYARGTWIDVPAAELVMRNHWLVGVFTGGFSEDEDRAINAELARLVEARQIATPLGAVHAFDAVPRVVQDLGSASPAGKIVVER